MIKLTRFNKRTNSALSLVLLSLVFIQSCTTSLFSSHTNSEAIALQNSFRQVVTSVLPAVVRVDVVELRSAPASGIEEGNPFFDFFFSPDEDEDGSEDSQPEFRSEGLGSGIIVREDEQGYFVLTNAHVIGEAQEIRIRLDDGRQFPALLVGKDTRKDLALLHFDSTDRDILVASLGNSDDLVVGDWVLAIGSPLGYQSTVTSGIVSALGRTGGPDGNISDFIQTDAAINRGNSGGALANIYGEVVGINTWISSQNGGNIGLGFSIPINNVKRSIDEFIEFGQVRYGWLGVSINSVDEAIAESLGATGETGALINSVYSSAPAGTYGLLPGDLVVAIEQHPVRSSEDLIRIVADLPIDRESSFTVVRAGERRQVDIVIANRESDELIAEQSSQLFPGFSVYPLTEEIRQQVGDQQQLPQGVIVTQVVPRSPAYNAGLQGGDIVISANEVEVDNLADLFARLSDETTEINLIVFRDEEEIPVSIAKDPSL